MDALPAGVERRRQSDGVSAIDRFAQARGMLRILPVSHRLTGQRGAADTGGRPQAAAGESAAAATTTGGGKHGRAALELGAGSGVGLPSAWERVPSASAASALCGISVE